MKMEIGWLTILQILVTLRILEGTRRERTLYVLLTALLQQGEPKLLRAAEVNLRSLLKQAQKASVSMGNPVLRDTLNHPAINLSYSHQQNW